ncbi:MAG: transporter [Flavobacteriales bacterium]|nr:transporter [Bacteroidota bacterium]MCB9241606.1 transporter [Flavobacteriales bacterium]
MTLRLPTFLSFLFFSFTLHAQIETDRPDFTESPNVVPRRVLQVESGFVFQHERQQYCGSEEVYKDIALNTTLLRYGITDKFELRLNWLLAQNGVTAESFPTLVACTDNLGNYPDTSFTQTGLTPLFVGYKTNLIKTDRFSLGMLGHLYLPFTAHERYRPSHYAAEFYVPMSFSINENWGIATQFSMSWDGDSPRSTTGYTLSISRSIGDKLGAYIEPFGYFTENGGEEHWINGGFTYLVNDRFQLDLTGGQGLSGTSATFVSTGLSFMVGGSK